MGLDGFPGFVFAVGVVFVAAAVAIAACVFFLSLCVRFISSQSLVAIFHTERARARANLSDRHNKNGKCNV